MNNTPKKNNRNNKQVKPELKLPAPAQPATNTQKPDIINPIQNIKPANTQKQTTQQQTLQSSDVSSDIESNENNVRKIMPPAKKSLFSRIRNQSKSGYSKIASKLASPVEIALDVNSTGMVPISQYKDELIAKAATTEETDLPPSLQSSGNVDDLQMPAIELDDYLKGRYAIKAEEFKRLQREQGFYFSDTLDNQILERARLNEGMFLMGVNLNSLVDLYRHIVFKEPLLDENGNPIPLPSGDILESGRAEDLTGEAYKVDYDKIYRDKMGFRLGPQRPLHPELVLRDDTPFDDIVRESAKYTGASYERISPKSLLNMIRVLDEYSKYELQWLRSATAIEIIYKYLSNGMPRQVFFSSESKLTEESLLELEEFFKTDNIFMTLDELREFKHDLNFYRSDEHRKLIDEKEKKKRLTAEQGKNNAGHNKITAKANKVNNNKMTSTA